MSLAEESSGWGRAEESQEGRAWGGIHRVHTWEQGWGDAVCPAPVPWSNSTNAASLACPSFNIHNSGLTEDTQRCIWLLESPGQLD